MYIINKHLIFSYVYVQDILIVYTYNSVRKLFETMYPYELQKEIKMYIITKKIHKFISENKNNFILNYQQNSQTNLN